MEKDVMISVKRSAGRRGLIRVEDCVDIERCSLIQHIEHGQERL